jgi:hypothetical protein
VFNINQITGAINPIFTASNSAVYGTAIHPSGRFLYAGNFSGSTVYPYTVSTFTGALTTGTFVSGPSVKLLMDPAGRFLYGITNSGTPNLIQLYTINQTTGALTVGPSITSSAATGAGHSMIIDPTGRYAYVTSNNTNWIGHYQIGSTGTLTLVSTATVTDIGGAVAQVRGIEPSGRFLYAVCDYSSSNATTNTIYTFVINQATGALSTASIVLAPSAQGYAWFDATGQNLITQNGIGGNLTLSVYSIDPASGSLSTSSSMSIATQQNGGQWIFEPQGRFAFQGQYQSNYVQSYTINSFAAGGATFAGQVVVSNTLTVALTTNAVSSVTGALQVSGGVGFGKDVYAYGTIYSGPNSGGLPGGIGVSNGVYTLFGGSGGSLGIVSGQSGWGSGSNQPTILLSNNAGLTLWGGSFGASGAGINLQAGAGNILVTQTTGSNSTSTTTGAIVVSNVGGIGVGGSVYVGNRVGFVDKTNVSRVYQVYNTVTNSLDTVFG